MNFSMDIWNSSVWELSGWTMIHFAWTGTALLTMVALTRLTLRRAHPAWRYATTLLLFTALALSPLAIAGYLAATWPEPPTSVAIAPPPVEESIAPLDSSPLELPPITPPTPEIIELTELNNIQLESLATPPEDSPIIELTDHPEFTNPEPQPLLTEPEPEPTTLPQNPIPIATEPIPTPNISPSSSVSSVGSVVNPSSEITRAEQLIAALDYASQYLPWFWLIGAPLTFALLATGLVGGERLRRSAELLTTGPIVEACEALKKQLKITRRVAIAVTDRVAQPVLVGIVRPMILLPWAALHGWRADQIEMVLVHELAHVRRWDNLVNLGQRVVESLLFYHPAVWLVSRWLRHDREECCDRVVVAHTGEPAEYADLLLSVASQLKPRRSLLVASAMAQHPLARRIRRLLQLEDDPMLVSRTSVLMGVAALVVAAVVAANYPLLAEGEQPAAEAQASAEPVADEAHETPSRPPMEVPVQELKKPGEWLEPGEIIATIGDQPSDDEPAGELLSKYAPILLQASSAAETDPFAEKLPPSPVVKVETFEDADHEITIGRREDGRAILKASPLYMLDLQVERITDEPVLLRSQKVSYEISGSTRLLREEGNLVFVAEKITATLPGGEVYSEGKEEELAESDSPFLSLEDQRVADLAYNMLGVEVEALPEESLPEVKAQGFSGGVIVISNGDISPSFRGRGERGSFFQPGDILVGIHVWPVTDFKSLGETLRREDLDEFPTLKMYVLRQMPVPHDPSTGEEGGFGAGMEPDGALPGVAPMEWQLQSGRVRFDVQAWQTEQNRINNEEPTPTRRSFGEVREAREREQSEREIEAPRPVPTADKTPIVEKEKLSQRRYDGRSFDEWRSQWRNELKVEERIEAIKAMTAFGRAGYGREAAEAIFDVAAQYSIATLDPNARERGLIEVVKSSLEGHNTGQGIAAKIWLPLLKERIGNDAALHRGLASELLPDVWLDEATLPIMEELTQHEDKVVRLAAFKCYFGNIGAEAHQAEVEEMFRRALKHDDVAVVVAALQSIAEPEQRGVIGRTWPVFERLHNQVAALLFHPSEEVRKEARYRLAVAVPETAEKIAGKALEVVKGKTVDGLTPTEAMVAALRALVVLVEPEMTDLNRIITKREGFQIEKDPAAYASYYYLWVATFDPERTPDKLEELKKEIAGNLDRDGLREFGRLFRNEFEKIVPEGGHNHANIMYVEGGGPRDPFGPGEQFGLGDSFEPRGRSGLGTDETTEIGESADKAEAANGTPLDRLRYKGRSFNQWRTEWRNELNVVERIEAIQALTSFGNAGYGGEAAEAIMEVAANLKLVEILGSNNSESPDYKLGSALQQALWSPGIPPSDWVPELIERYDDQPEGFARLLNQLLRRFYTDPALPLEPVLEFARRRDPLLEGQEIKLLLIADPEIKTPEVETFIRQSIMHDDLRVRIRALEVLTPDPTKLYRPDEKIWQAMKKFVPELVSNLMHDDPSVARKATGAISHPETRTAIVAELRQMFEGSKVPPSTPGDPENTESGALAARVAALRALGRIYVDDEETTQALLKLAGSQPDELARVAAVVLDILDNGMYDGSRRDGYDRLLDRLVEERTGADEENKEALRARLIEEIGPQMDAEAAAIDPFYDVAAKPSEDGNIELPKRPGFAQGFQEEPATDPLSPAEPMQGTAPPSLQKSPETPEPTTEIADSPEKAAAANGTPPDRVRYQGRSFDDWRSQWQNELDVAQRTEAIKALSAFARAGFGREAADAILEVAAQYNMATSDGHSPEFLLVQAIKSSLESRYSSAGIPAEVWMNVLKERVEADPKTFKPFLAAMLPIANLTESTRPIVDELSRSEDKEIRRAAFELYFYHVDSIEIEVDEELRRALAHEDPTIVMYAIRSMVRYQSVDRGTPPRVIALPVVERLRPEVLETLFHREEAARQFARWLIASTDDTLARRFANDLVKRLAESEGNAPEVTDTRIAALRALGALGPRAKAASMESNIDSKSFFDDMDMPTRAAWAVSLFQVDLPENWEEVSNLSEVPTPLTQGLSKQEVPTFTAQLVAETKQVYPQGHIPAAAAKVFKVIDSFGAESREEPAPE